MRSSSYHWISRTKLFKYSVESKERFIHKTKKIILELYIYMNTQHNQRDLYLAIFAFDANGSLLTDNIAYSQVWHELVYKDV